MIWIWSVVLFLELFANPIATSSVRFTNIKCQEFDPNFATFQKFYLKVVGRGLIALNIDVKLFQVPVSNITINLSLHKKANGYRPFLYNLTTDFCKFMKNRKQYPFVKIFFDALLQDSNINHTCPYAHNIIINRAVLNENNFKYLPLPKGEYMFQLKVAAYNDWKADVKASVAIDTDFGNKY